MSREQIVQVDYCEKTGRHLAFVTDSMRDEHERYELARCMTY